VLGRVSGCGDGVRWVDNRVCMCDDVRVTSTVCLQGGQSVVGVGRACCGGLDVPRPAGNEISRRLGRGA